MGSSCWFGMLEKHLVFEMRSSLRADEEHLKPLGLISFFINFETGFASVIPSVLGAVLEALGNPPSVCYL